MYSTSGAASLIEKYIKFLNSQGNPNPNHCPRSDLRVL